MEPERDEVILADVAANLIRGIEAVGGRLTITTRRVLFKPHVLNVQKQPEEIPLDAVAEVGLRNTLGVLPNGFFLRTKTGTEHHFVAWNRRKLLRILAPRDQADA